jgi:C-terminal peptidase prc
MNSKHTFVAALLSIFLVLFGSASQSYSASTVDPPKAPATKPIPSMDKQCEDLYHRVWQRINREFLFRDRLCQWKTWEHKFDGKMTTAEDCRAKVNLMLDSLHDDYTYLKDSGSDDSTAVVTEKLLGHNIGYIKIPTFLKHNVALEVKGSLLKLKSAKAYILDLRDNGGGYVDDAYQTFTLFVNDGVFVYMTKQDFNKPGLTVLSVSKNMTRLDHLEEGKVQPLRLANLAAGKPLVVLVNQDTASAAEMFALALRDNRKALLIGSITYGKGIAQTTYNGLPFDTSLQLTDSWWLSPSGVCIHRHGGQDKDTQGIKPDFIVLPGKHGDRQQQFAENLLRKQIQAK